MIFLSKYFKMIVLFILFAALVSCSGNPLSGFFSSPSPENQNQDILFSDDFSNPGSGWDRQRNADGITDYQNGQYLIEVDRANYDYFSNPSVNLSDVRIEVEASNSGKVTDNEFGIICRSVGKNDFYAGLISSDGFYGIFKVKGGDYQLLGMEVMAKSAVIKSGSEKNRLRLDCIGKEIRLFVNNVQVDVRQDGDFTKGDIGLLAGAYQVSGVKILFDNLVVRKP